MKCKFIFVLLFFLLPVVLLHGTNDNEKESGVVITPHKKVCILPDANAPVKQQMSFPQHLSSVRGSLAYGNDIQHATMYHFDIDDPSVISTDGNATFTALCGDFMPDDPLHMWVIDHNDEYLKMVNLETLAVIDSVNTPCPLADGLWSALPIHKTTGQIYGIATNTEISVLYEINPYARSVTELLVIDIRAVISATFDLDGMMYMFDIDTDQIYALDINTLFYEPIGPAGFDGNYAQGMGLDPATNELYLAAYVEVDGPQLRHLDKLTGNTTLIGDLPGETGAFGFPHVPAEDYIAAGTDHWCVPYGYIEFGDNGDYPPLPPDFFGPGSDPFEGIIKMTGANSDGAQLPQWDAVISRLEDLYFTPPYPSMGEVPVQIDQISLKSEEPILVNGGGADSFFDVFVEIDFGYDRGGMNNVTKEDNYGGTFEKDFYFWPIFTFVEVDNPSNTLVYNPGQEGLPPLAYASMQPYPWTHSPVPNEFDPMGDDLLQLQSMSGNDLFLMPLLLREDFFFLDMSEEGYPLAMEGTGYNNGTWYYYPNTDWWNVWFYDHPVNTSHTKMINGNIMVEPRFPDLPSYVEIVFNWSTTEWPGWPETVRPPLPEDVPDPVIEELMIQRSDQLLTYQGNIFEPIPVPIDQFQIPDFNPEWLSIDIRGYNFVINGNLQHVCFKPFTPDIPDVEIMGLKVGDWLTAEPWHDWIGGMNRSSEVQLLVHDVGNQIMQVDFEFSIDGGANWELFFTDTDGSESAMSTYEPSGDGDGWMAIFPHEILPPEDMEIIFRANATLENGDVLMAERAIPFDPTPPDGADISLEDWMIIEDDHILLDIAPGECLDLDKVWILVEPKIDSFFKGIPPISQQPHSTTHCSPTAAAACLKYFESQGDSDICGGLSDHDLVDALAEIMKTNQGKSGTYISDIASGLATWISNNGNDYTVRKTGYDWETMRNELERCQDVISSIFWPNGGGHSMTFNSIVNEPNPDGTITVDWMDPWTGEIEYGQITPSSGHVGNMGGAGNGGSGEMGTMIIVCPEEDDPGPGGGGQVIPGPFPNPGIVVPIPDPGLWWIRIIFYDQSNHVARTDLVLKRVEGEKDWGDAPDGPYPTLAASSGAFHTLDGFTYMGATVDAEPDGQPNANATGDDNDGNDDEDGITFGPIMPGSAAQITITPNIHPDSSGYLQGWMDFNNDGDWDDPGERIFVDECLRYSIPACLLYLVPADAQTGSVYARFRFSTAPGLNYFGPAPDGEVEDYMVEIVQDEGYKWLQEPCPELSGLHCHDYVIPPDTYDYITIADDWQCDGGVVTDIHWWGNYEGDMGSGIDYFHLSIHMNDTAACLPMPQEIWGMDVPFAEVNETLWGYNKWGTPIYTYEYILDIPFEQEEGQTYWLDITAYSNDPNDPAIWRWQESDRSTAPFFILCPAATYSFSNPVWSNIVWDATQPPRYTEMAFAITSEMIEKDLGDAPQPPYPTKLNANGASHVIDGITFLGDLVDGEPDGQPNVPATGDDINNLADEDGVVFRTPLVEGNACILKVKASVDGKLNVWIDIDRNNSWADAADHVFVDYDLVAGWNTLTLNVPANAATGFSYMRFRFNQQGGLDFEGPATNGEVEDYRVKIFPEGWSFIPTPVTHTILVPLNVLLTSTSLSAQDAIGVWYEDDNGNLVCGGADIWTGNSDRIVLAYGDDNTTPEKDGFDEGEALTWKIHHTATGTDEYVTVEYDPTMPQSDGKFTGFGLSKLTEMIGLSVTATAVPSTVCAGDTVQLDAIAAGGSGNYTYSWTSNPLGFTSNDKDPVDFPAQDITYTVAVDDGLSMVSASVSVSVQPGPAADAGIDVTICEGDNNQLAATATDYSVLAWTTNGDGTFSNAGMEDPVYFPGPNDIANGSVTLSLTAFPVAPCTGPAVSHMVITFEYLPLVDAGDDDSVCAGSGYQLQGSVMNSNSYMWSTGGDGTFDDKTALDAIYTPGPLDAANGMVTLTLTADPIPPCQAQVQSSIVLTVLETQVVSLFDGWNGLSSYLSPFNQNNNYDLFGPVLNELVIVYNMQGDFWPDQSVNTLVWDEESGYVIKLDTTKTDYDMIFCGDEVSDKVVDLSQNWNIVPVLCDFDADITSVFDAGVDVKLVLEVAGWKVFWPDYNINTILDLESGKSYFAYMNSDDAIDFGNATLKSGRLMKPVAAATTPWNEVIQSPGGHVVAFTEAACEKFASGDVIGAFTGSGLCAAITSFENTSTGIVLKGDDPYTWPIDGFTYDEAVTYKLFRPSTGETFRMQVAYESTLDQSGRYHDFSMSAITDVKMTPTGVHDPAGSGIRIYPNPSHGIFNVEGISEATQIRIFDSYGNEVYRAVVNEQARIDLAAKPNGIYLVKIKTLNGIFYQKVIIN